MRPPTSPRGSGGLKSPASPRGKKQVFFPSFSSPSSSAQASSAAASASTATHHTAAEPSSFFTTLVTYWVYLIALLLGLLRDACARVTGRSQFFVPQPKHFKGFPPILNAIDSFYSRRLYYRYRDVWNRPLAGPPGSEFDVYVRQVDPQDNKLKMVPGEHRRMLNLGSYNYLGISGERWNETCAGEVYSVLASHGQSSSTSDLVTALQTQLERTIASFLGKEDCVVFSQGYGTNAWTIPSLVSGKGTLVISDSLNHTSIVNGVRGSGALVRVYRHNDEHDLEALLKHAIAFGQPKSFLPFTKILVMTEGIFSMEGEVCRLKQIAQVCKRYKAYLYVDEAHSIGALGKTGRGVCEQTGVDTADVDVLMGTFTKSFGAMGGYIASSKHMCDYLRTGAYRESSQMSPVVIAQIMASFRYISTTEDGLHAIQQIKDNANYFRARLEQMGCEVLGDRDSPVIPLMLYIPTKISLFSQLCFERDVAVVVVGFPAVPLNAARARICISAGHTREQLDRALAVIEDVVDIIKLRYKRSVFG